MENVWKYLESFGITLVFAGIGWILGSIGGFWWGALQTAAPSSPSISIPSSPPSVITLLSIENGILKAKAQGADVRMILNAHNTVSASNSEFAISIAEILPMLKSIPAPSGMYFVASKSGKKYYPLDSPNAFLLSVKNRVFFETEAQAIASGRSKGK